MDSIQSHTNTLQQREEASFLARMPKQQLNSNDYLKLVVAQATHQNPLEPQKNDEFMATMAQFSHLEQSKENGAQLKELCDLLKVSVQNQACDMRTKNLTQATQTYLGKQVTLNKSTETEVKGIVSKVEAAKDGSILVGLGKKTYPVDMISVTKLSKNETSNNILSTTQ